MKITDPPQPKGKAKLLKKSWAMDLIQWLKENRVCEGLNIFIEDSTDGKRINSDGGAGVAGGAADAVVQVRRINGEWKAGVIASYYLQQPIVAGSTPVELEVTGKLTTGANSDPGWLPTYENDQVWIEGTVTSLVADSAFVQSYGDSGSEGGGAIENDGATPAQQSKFRIFLGEILANGDTLYFHAFAGKYHRLGLTFGDSKDSEGGNFAQISALCAEGM